MDYKTMTAPCGRDCFNCPFHLTKNNAEMRAQFAKRMETTEENVVCEGCRKREGKCKVLKTLGFQEDCKTFACCAAKNIEFCFECSDFPCDRLHPLADRAERFPHNLKVYNLCLIQRVGVEEWAKNMAKRSFDKYYRDKLDSLFQ
jgi:hypothetical protein